MLNIDKLHFQGPALLVKTRRNGPAAPCLVWNDSSPNADKVDLVRFHVATKLACFFFYISQSAAALSPLVFSPLVVSPLFSKATKKFYTVNALYQCQFIQLLSPFLTRPLFFLFIWQLNFSELDGQQITFCVSVLCGRHSKHWQMTP